MTYYDEQLQQLQKQLARKRQLESQAQELRRQRDALSARVRELEAVMLAEQADVERLEGRSLAAFFYNVVGKMDERLDKEREEAYAARVKYAAAARELEGTESDLRHCEGELSGLDTADRVLSSLESAEGWGTWDLFGGGLISDLAKHSRLDEAQGEIEYLQSQLPRPDQGH